MEAISIALSLLLAGLSVAALMAARHFFHLSKRHLLEPVSQAFAVAPSPGDCRGTGGGEGGSVRVVLVGDSRIKRWNPDIGNRGWCVLNWGIAGESAAQMRLRLVEILALKPQVVVIQSGINDLVALSVLGARESEGVRKTVGHLKAFAESAASSGAEVLLTTIVPPANIGLLRRLAWGSALCPLVRNANDMLRSGRQPARVTVVDLARRLGPDGMSMSPVYSTDALHLNAAGYSAMGETVLPVIEAAIAQCREQDADVRSVDATAGHPTV